MYLRLPDYRSSLSYLFQKVARNTARLLLAPENHFWSGVDNVTLITPSPDNKLCQAFQQALGNPTD